MRLILALILSLPAFAQNTTIFAALTGDITLASSASTVLTIQQPATGAKQVQLWRAVVSCDSQSFLVGQAINGTAATSTAVTPVASSPILGTPTPTPTVTAWKASNVGTGTAVWNNLGFTAATNAPVTLDLSQMTMLQVGTGSNYSITLTNTGGSSCTARIAIQWKEGDLLNGATQSIP